MNRTAPIILVSASRQKLALNHSGNQDVTVLNNAIIDILIALGAIPVLLPVHVDHHLTDSFIEKFDGLVLSSGQDISPSNYDQVLQINYAKDINGIGSAFNRPALIAPDIDRDNLEIALYKSAKRKMLPILGVCRGMQLINVAEGGSLFQETPESYFLNHSLEHDGWINYHEVIIEDSSQLGKITEALRINMSSIHHQSIDRVGKDLKVSGRSQDGLIEAIESADPSRFILGLQGHFEKSLKNDPANLKIWQAFVDASNNGVVYAPRHF